MGEIINLKKKFKGKQLETIIKNCMEQFPEADSRIIGQIATNFFNMNYHKYKNNRKDYFPELKKKTIEVVRIRLKDYNMYKSKRD